ncbi:IniB N-terminal domain-containing protein [Actinoplanes sp. NPDC026670]|uniref:IniB N-terminal domain-containing protein n=1 Tax=Actinoplanes sp. NPDC026670 TaxID=3154700 RepID=UPI0033CFEA93
MTSPTLQDFVLNLIYDPAARSAFELDPEATLRHAGLDDITATDVQQVLPLVLDSAPVTGLTGPDGLDDLTTGVASLDVAGAVAQLQAIAAQVTHDPLAEVNASSSVNVSVLGLDALDVNVGVGAGTSLTVGGLSADHDPDLVVDSAVHSAVTSSTFVSEPVPYDAGLTGDLTSGLTGDVGGVLDTVTHVPSVVEPVGSGLLDVAGVHEATSSIGSLIQPDLSGVTSLDVVDGLGDTVTGTVSGVGGTLHGLTGGLTGGLLSGGDQVAEQPDAHGEVFGIL